MFIEKDNLVIRNANADDAKLLAAWWNDGAVMAHAGFPNGTGQTAEGIAESLAKDTDETHRRLIIEHDKTPVGEMNYRNKGAGTAELGIKICDVSKQEKGYGRKLLSMLISHLFESLGYSKIILDTNTNNTRAQYIYEKLGFRRLRVNVDSWRNPLGELQSSIDYDLTKADFLDFSKDKYTLRYRRLPCSTTHNPANLPH